MLKRTFLLLSFLLLFFGSMTHSIWSENQNKKVAPMLSESEKKELLQIARESLAHYLKTGEMKEFHSGEIKIQ